MGYLISLLIIIIILQIIIIIKLHKKYQKKVTRTYTKVLTDYSEEAFYGNKVPSSDDSRQYDAVDIALTNIQHNPDPHIEPIQFETTDEFKGR